MRGRRLQRFFSTFPAGLPGLGLLLLRTAVGLAAIFHAGTLLFSGSLSGSSAIVALTAIASGILILIGLVTPFASITLFIVTVAAWIAEFVMHHDGLTLPVPAMTCAVVTTAALALLGPGAYSVDARMFGRREIVIPKSPGDSKS